MKRKLLSVVLALVLLLGLLPSFSMNAEAADGIRISSTHFPDAKFRAYVKTYDTDGNGYLSYAERNVVEVMDVSNKGIADLTGIRRFSSLKELNCSKNKLTELDVTENTSLQYLDCSDNELEYLYFGEGLQILDCTNNILSSMNLTGRSGLLALYCSNNHIHSINTGGAPLLQELYCDNNSMLDNDLNVKNSVHLRELSFSHNLVANVNLENLTELEVLYCDNNIRITQLNLTNNKKLTALDCSNCSLKTLDLSQNTKLKALGCANNKLTGLDLSSHPLISVLYCGGNQLTSLKLSKNNTVLSELDCSENALTSLNVTYATSLQILDCSGNELAKLNLANNSLLTQLYCASNALASLTVSNMTGLQYLDCSDNSLTELDVTLNTALVGLGCANNGLSALDVRNNTKLQTLLAGSNQLSSLNVNKNTKLVTLDVSSNKLTSLTLTYNTALQKLYCGTNQLTKLGLSKNTKLVLLSVSDNKISSIDLSNQPGLQILYIAKNKLKTLDVSQNSQLKMLLCEENQLTELDVGNNPDLQYLTCHKNQITALDIGNNEKLVSAFDSTSYEEDGVQVYYLDFYDEHYNLLDEYLLAIDSSVNLTGRKPTIEVQPKNQIVGERYVATFSVQASGGGLSYQWYYRTSADGTWKKVSDEWAKQAEFVFQTKPENDGYQYRCKVSNSKGYVYSKTVTLHLSKIEPEILDEPADQEVKAGEKVTFTVGVEGDYLEYQWYYNKNQFSGGWTAVTAASGKTATYSFTAQERHDRYIYICRIENPLGMVETRECTIKVSSAKPVITNQSERNVVKVGNHASFFVGATGGGLNYQWYYRTSASGSWKKISAESGKTNNYGLFPEERHNGYQYRCKVSNLFGSVYSAVRTLTVVTEGPTLVTQPEDQTVLEGNKAAFSVGADGRGLSYQWYYRTSSNGEWTAVSAEAGKTADYSLTAKARHNGYQYRCAIINPIETVYTDVVTLTVVSNAPQITAQPADKSVAEGEKATFTVKATGEALSYQWYYRTSETGEWAEVTAASGKTAKFSLTAKARHNGYQYRCVVTNLKGSAVSEIVTLTVN